MKTAEVTVEKIHVGDTLVHDSGELIRITTKVTKLEGEFAIYMSGDCPTTISPNGKWSTVYRTPNWIEKVLIENE